MPEGKGPPLDVIPSACVPAAENIHKRNAPRPNQGGQDAQENDDANEPRTGEVSLPVEASLTNEGLEIGEAFVPVEVPPALPADEQDKTVALYSGNFVPSGSGEEVSENKTTQEKYRGNPIQENRRENSRATSTDSRATSTVSRRTLWYQHAVGPPKDERSKEEQREREKPWQQHAPCRFRKAQKRRKV